MRLNDLIRELQRPQGVSAAACFPDIEIARVTADSRRVDRDTLFVAVRGAALDGHRFVRDAVRRGAAVVVVERPSLHVAAVRRSVAPGEVAEWEFLR